MARTGEVAQRSVVTRSTPLAGRSSDAGLALLRPLVVVLGGYRTGMSVCANVLAGLGVDIADEAQPAPPGTCGDWERRELVEFHDRILARYDRTLRSPLHDFPLPGAWWADPATRSIQREIVEFLHQRMASERTLIGFKDPQTARLLPVWHQIFRELAVAPKIVLCLRNPAAVARSLQQSEGLSNELGEYRWFTYMVDIFRNLRDYEFCTIEYETWFTDPGDNAKKLLEFLGLDWDQSEADLMTTIADIVDPGRRRHASDGAEARQPLIRSFYRLARRCESDAGVRQHIGSIVNQFVAFKQLNRPLERQFGQMDRLAGSPAPQSAGASAPPAAEPAGAAPDRLDAMAAARDDAGVQREALETARARLAGLRGELAARNAALIEASARADAEHAEAGRREAELTELHGRLAELRAELGRDGSARSVRTDIDELAMLREEFAARDAALTEAARRAAEALVSLEAMEAALAERQALHEAGEKELAALRAELDMRDAALAAAQQRLDRQAAELARLRVDGPVTRRSRRRSAVEAADAIVGFVDK